MHTRAKTQQNAIHTSHIIAKYVLETNMPMRLGIYAKYVDLYGRWIHIYVPHIPLQIWLPACTYMFHCTARQCTYGPHIDTQITKHLVFDTNIYKVVGINAKKTQ